MAGWLPLCLMTWGIMVWDVLVLLAWNFEVWFLWVNMIIFAFCRAVVYQYGVGVGIVSSLSNVVLLPCLILIDAVTPRIRLRYFGVKISMYHFLCMLWR
eukprot:UN29251